MVSNTTWIPIVNAKFWLRIKLQKQPSPILLKLLFLNSQADLLESDLDKQLRRSDIVHKVEINKLWAWQIKQIDSLQKYEGVIRDFKQFKVQKFNTHCVTESLQQSLLNRVCGFM